METSQGHILMHLFSIFLQARETKAYSVQLNTRYYGEVEMQFVIPAQQEKHFVFVQQSGQLSSMVLPTKQEQVCTLTFETSLHVL